LRKEGKVSSQGKEDKSGRGKGEMNRKDVGLTENRHPYWGGGGSWDQMREYVANALVRMWIGELRRLLCS
jgi:hypothetical protein